MSNAVEQRGQSRLVLTGSDDDLLFVASCARCSPEKFAEADTVSFLLFGFIQNEQPQMIRLELAQIGRASCRERV